MTAQIIVLALPAARPGPFALHAPKEDRVASAVVITVDEGVAEYADDRKGGRHGLPDHDESRGVVAHQGKDDDDAEQ